MVATQRIRSLLMREVLPGRRGAAMPVVLIVVAVLTTVVVQFVHETRTNLHMAANVRDEVRAYYNAKAGMDLARLALGAQALIDTLAGRSMNIQVWQYLNQFMGAFNAARVDTPLAAVDLSGVKGLGGIKGSFDVDVIAEDGKINLNALAGSVVSRNATIARLTVLMSPAQYRPMFEEKDERGNYNDIPEIIASLIDWVDFDSNLTNMNADGLYLPGAGGQEANRYGAFDMDYEARNHRLDTLEEAQLVKGIGDRWWRAFSQALTVYPSNKINVNTADPLLLAVTICSHLANPNDLYCDPFNLQFLSQAVTAVTAYRMLMRNLFMTPFASTRHFTDFLRTGGQSKATLMGQAFSFEPPLLNWGNLQKDIEVRSPKVYRITAKGRVGNTVKTLIAVIDISKKGQLYYWREF